MLLITLPLLIVGGIGPITKEAPVVPALGRPLSWDPYGAYPLDAESPLTSASRRIVKDLMEAELGRAEAIVRYRLQVDKEDLVPAWAMSQIVRVHKQVMVEYERVVAPHVGEPASRPVRLYRFYICHLAFGEFMKHFRGGKSPLYNSLIKDMKRLRNESQADAANSLGLTIALTNGDPFWVLNNRLTLEAYSRRHPKGPDVRPLICRAYLDGVRTMAKGITLDDAPNPQRALGIAQSILNDRPKDPYGLYYRGRCNFVLGKTPEAVRDIKAARETGELPSVFARVADTFLSDPSEAAFFSIPIVG